MRLSASRKSCLNCSFAASSSVIRVAASAANLTRLSGRQLGKSGCGFINMGFGVKKKGGGPQLEPDPLPRPKGGWGVREFPGDGCGWGKKGIRWAQGAMMGWLGWGG